MKRARMAAIAVGAALAPAFASSNARNARADEHSVPVLEAARKIDTAYGRIDGDMAALAGVGVTFGPRSPRAAADLRLRYLQTAGIFATYEDGPLASAKSDPRRIVAFGVELRPLFFARWLEGMELGVPRIDLAIDSFGLELGAVFMQPEGSAFGARPGLQAGIGFDLPIFSKATGPMLSVHAGCRFSDHALAGDELTGPSDRSLYFNVLASWQQIFGAHVVDLGDRPPR
ncbi:MAG: hypothetical protein FWD73_03815 [Polyangiaceae bacterium]|nr:hypothetical protein [Polyangiaceae bacterium]